MARLQKHAAGDHPLSTEDNSLASGLLQQLDDIPSSFVPQTPAVSPAVSPQHLSMRHPYTHPRLVQPAHAPMTSQLQALGTPPCGQPVPGTVLVDHYTMLQVSNCATPSMLYRSSVGPPLVPSGRQDALVASDSVPDHLHPICNITSPLTQRGHQSQNYPGVLYHQQMTFDVATPQAAQMEQHSIYSPETPDAQVYQGPRGFEESNGVYFDNADQAFVDLPIGPSPTEFMALQNNEREPATDATQCFSSQTPHYNHPGASYGLPLASPPSLRLNPTDRHLRADYMDAITAGSNVYGGDVKNNSLLNEITLQAPYEMPHVYNAMPCVVSPISSCDWAPPGHPCGADHCRIPIDNQPYINHGAPTAQLASVTHNITFSQSSYLADPAVDGYSKMQHAMRLAFGSSAQFPSSRQCQSHIVSPVPQMSFEQRYESSRADSFYGCDSNSCSDTWSQHSALSQSIPNLLGRGASSNHEYLRDGFESTSYQMHVGAEDGSPQSFSTGTWSSQDQISSATDWLHPYNVLTD
ncbi:hypothetical protein A0H81_13141 [Grifola frondosa]|uniref:Uncharacterized protein n=1 Tax=Grifola frondosa TaxID=5627 RepID=A0A1C7LQD8_GRIFR|nr:hypothetical protein A0H81_13141 [Grifola frondosa]